MLEEDKWICEECSRVVHEIDVLEAQNPFDFSETLDGCPHCKAVNSLAKVCDEPSCREIATCGTPTSNGYRRTCGPHMPKELE